ncbi:MAG: hypothetical protein MJ152_00440 [Clostridia bacterium]|nr:hypothetical protein [Clostridia bacterium]
MLKFVFEICKRDWWKLILVILISVVSALCSQYVFSFIGYVIDYGINFVGKTYSGPWSFIFSGYFGEYGTIKLTITLAICSAIFAIANYLLNYWNSYFTTAQSQVIANRVRISTYYQLKNKKLPYSVGDFLVIFQEDIYNIGSIYLSVIPNIIVAIVTTGFCLYMLGSINPYLLITPIVLSPAIVVLGILYHKATYKANKAFRDVDGELKETVNQAIGTESKDAYNQFEKQNELHTKNRKDVALVGQKYSLWLNLVKIAIYIISCTIAGILTINGSILIGEYLIFIAFVNTIFSQILSFIDIIASIKSTKPRIEKVQKLMEAK